MRISIKNNLKSHRIAQVTTSCYILNRCSKLANGNIHIIKIIWTIQF
jgi:hypothetical protein